MTETFSVTPFPGPQPAAQAAAARIIDAAAQAIAARGVFHLGLSGGSTPQLLFSLLAAQPAAIQWERVRLVGR